MENSQNRQIFAAHRAVLQTSRALCYNILNMYIRPGGSQSDQLPPVQNGRPPRQRAKPAAPSAQVRGGLHVLYYAAAAAAVRLKGSFP